MSASQSVQVMPGVCMYTGQTSTLTCVPLCDSRCTNKNGLIDWFMASQRDDFPKFFSKVKKEKGDLKSEI